MKLIKNKNLLGYFGTAQNDLKHHGEYVDQNFEKLKTKLNSSTGSPIKTLLFLEQTHSTKIFVVDQNTKLQSPLDLRNHQGDAIITNQKNIAIGVATADCLPLFLYDPVNQIIAVVHAGWRGLIAGIISKTIKQMTIEFKTKPSDIKVYLGPCAKVCCYEVQKDFLTNVPADAQRQGSIEVRNEKLFFNNLIMVQDELTTSGILKDSINTQNNVCTICTPGFCSVRNGGQMTGRQPSVAFLI